MESPEGWSLLTASLAVCNLGEPNPVWAFLAVQGLVRDAPGDREAFAAFIREEFDRGAITGPSLPRRVAGHLSRAGIARPAAQVADPGAAVARRRRDVVAAWQAGDAVAEQPAASAPPRSKWWRLW
jgi:hypothetical protein